MKSYSNALEVFMINFAEGCQAKVQKREVFMRILFFFERFEQSLMKPLFYYNYAILTTFEAGADLGFSRGGVADSQKNSKNMSFF